MTGSHAGPDERIAVAVSRRRNLELLRDLFESRPVVELADAVPENTGLCIVDEAGLARSGTAIEAWKRHQYPTFAPVLLVSEGAGANPWETHADKLGDQLDAILSIPKPKEAIAARIESLLETRAYSKALLGEREMIDKILQTSPIAMTVLDADGNIRRANDRAETVLGLTKSEIEGRAYNAPEWEIVDENGETVPDEKLPFSRVSRTEEPIYGYEHGIERPSGETVWLSINMAPVFDERGSLEFLIATLDDVTEQREQQRELERQLDLFDKAQDIASVGAWEYDLRTQEAYWTSKVPRIHGLPPDADPSPELSLEYYHPEDRPVIERAFERAITEGEEYDLELRLLPETGETRWVRTRGEPQFEDGELVRVRGTFQDITDRKERSLELRQMSRAVEYAPIGVTLTDPQLDHPDAESNPLVYVNERFLELTGYDREDVIGRNCRFLQGEGTDPAVVAEIRDAIDDEEPVSVVLKNYRADGTEFWNSLEIAPVRDDAGDVINFIGFQHDVTERVERRRQLQKIDQVLRHNLKNSLTVIQGMADQIQRETGDTASAYAQRIIDTGDSLLTTLEKEREITKLLGEDPAVEPVELMASVRNIAETVEAENPGATVEVVGPDAVTVSGSPYLRSALGELIRNAVEHDPGDENAVSVAVREEAGSVVVEIVDEGPGIPEMEIGILTGDEEETQVQHGQGLGLWLVQLIVRRSGGQIEFETDAHGSTVRVTLAACDPADDC